MKIAVLHLLLAAVFAVSTAVADGQISLSPQVIDLGEIVAGGCCTREFTISNVTENVVAIERIESEAEVSVLIFKDALAAHDHQTVCVCLKAGQVIGDFAADVSIFARGSSGSVVRLRLLGKVVESDDGFIYSDAGFGTVSYGMSVTGTNCVVWRCRERMQKCLATEHETNLISRVIALDALRGPWSDKDQIFAFCTEEMSRLLRPLLLEGKCSDAEKEELIEKCGFKTHFIHNTELDKEVRDYLYNKEVSLAKAKIAKENAERDRLVRERRKAREDRERAQQEAFAKFRAESMKRDSDLSWRRVELPGEHAAKVWEEYLAGEGKPFADNVHFKTNVFLPFLVREFGVGKVGDESLRKKILEFLETEFADPLCHVGEGAERAKSFGKASSLARGCWGESVNWAYERWIAGEKHNPFVLAFAPFYAGKDRKIKLRRLKGRNGSALWGGVYEFSEEFVPSGREGLPIHFVRNICRCRNRGQYSEDYPDKHDESLVAWCRALEKEGARPEHWRCVLLLSLRVAGSSFIPRPNIRMADALEKAGVAPFLVEMLREEPIYKP